MEKRVPHKSSKLLNEAVAGCWGGFFQSIGIHQHLHLRKLLGQRRDHKGIKDKRGKTYLPLAYDEEQQDAILQPEDRSGSSGRNSTKTHIRAVIGQRSKGKQKRKKQKANPYSGRRLTRTTSIHHMECNDYVIPGEIPDDRKFHEALQNSASLATASKELPSLPSEVVNEVNQGKRCKACGMQSSSEKHAAHFQLDALGSHLVVNQAHFRERVSELKYKLVEDQVVDCNDDRRDAALGHSKDLLEALELFHENRDLILKIIHEKYTTFPISLQDHEEVSRSGRVLTKFGSFPGQGFSGRTSDSLELRSRKEKSASLKENIEVSNIENLQALSTTHSTDVKPISDDQRDHETASRSKWPPNFADVRSKKDFGAAVYRFKDIKQRIKDMIKENQNERYRISMDGILHKVPYGRKISQEKLSRSEGDGLRRSFSSGRAVPSYVGSYSHMRSHSLSESMDRYYYLLESNISREPRRQVPERLKMIPGDSTQSSSQALSSPRTFKRMFSLPDYDPHFLSKGHRSEESVYPAHSCSTSVDAIQEHPAIHINGTSGQKMQCKNESCLKPIKDNGSSSRCIIADTVYVGSVKEKNESTHVNDMDLFYKVEWNNEPNLDDYVEFSSSSVPVKPGQACMMELRSPGSTEDPYDTNGSSIAETSSDITDLRDPAASPQNDLNALPSSSHHVHEFHLVKNTLKKHWLDAEASHPPSSSPAEAADDSGHDPTNEPLFGLGSVYEELLSDLTDEVLLDMYADSNGHRPWLSDSTSRIRRVPEGRHLLAEVWAEVGWYLGAQAHADVNMDAVISRDYNKKDRWLKLHDDVESVGMDLELQMLDDLLDEVTADCLDLARSS